jgi:26S proteasome regulatory subunit N1
MKSQQPKTQDKDKVKKEEMSEENAQLKELITHLVDKIVSPDESERERVRYIGQLFDQVKQISGSGTTLPKQLKFLHPQYPRLVDCQSTAGSDSVCRHLADLMSLVAITLEENYDRHSLRYLQKGTGTIDLDSIGDEFILNLAGDLSAEFDACYEKDQVAVDNVFALTDRILGRMFKHGHEINAVDLLLDIERLDKLKGYLDSQNYNRIFTYLLSFVEYSADHHEHDMVQDCLFESAMHFGDFTNALRVALRVNNYARINEVIAACNDKEVRCQLALNLGRHRIFNIQCADSSFTDIVSNKHLSAFYKELQKDLDVVEEKLPVDVYKNMVGATGQKIDSAQLNLADSFVNGLVNIGSLREALVNNPKENEKVWLQRVKDSGIMSTVASLGLVHMWNFESCSEVLAEFFDLKDGFAKAGACIALGISTSGVWDENDPTKAMLLEALESEEPTVKLGAVIGLGLAYTGSSRGDFKDILEQLINNETLSIETCACSALSQALINVSDCDEDVSNSILTSLMVFQPSTLDKKFAGFLAVALGLNFMGQLNKSDAVIEALQSVEHRIGRYAELVVDICSHVGTSNVLKIQGYMQRASVETTDPNEIELQCVALIGVAFLSISEPVGKSVFMRLIHQLLYYSPTALKRAVPIMLTIMGVVNGSIQISDMLFKLAHDDDAEIAYRAIFGLGVVGAGTNNSRLATLLRSLAAYYENENNFLYVVRIALGMLHAGKGLVGINPFYSNGFLCSKSGLAGLIVTSFSMLHFEEFLITKNHYMLFYISLSVYPKMLFYTDANLKEIKTAVRVGQGLDTVAQVGKPRTITGFQTHTSPVIINLNEKAELGTEEFISVADSVQENFVVLKKNPDFVEKR